MGPLTFSARSDVVDVLKDAEGSFRRRHPGDVQLEFLTPKSVNDFSLAGLFHEARVDNLGGRSPSFTDRSLQVFLETASQDNRYKVYPSSFSSKFVVLGS